MEKGDEGILRFEKIGKSFGNKPVLENVSFDVQRGEIFGLVSESAGGKSTLLKIIIGMIKASEGRIFFDGKDAFREQRYVRKNTGFATQRNLLFNELTVKENSYYFASIYGVSKADFGERFKKLIDLFRLNGFENVRLEHLSGGTLKRVNLLVSLVNDPKLLILDEPTQGLDPLLRKIIWDYIHEINKRGATILVTSHLLDEIEANCGRIAVIKKGKVIAIATPEQYREKYGSESFTELFQRFLENDIL